MKQIDSDAALMLKVQEGNAEAFEELMHRHLRQLHAYVFRLCQNTSEAEEIVQEAFMRVWSRARTWMPKRVKFTTWLFQIARNLCIDRFRKQTARLDSSIDLDLIPDSSTELDKELVLALHQVVQELPERQRTALVLCQIEGWTQSEVAEVMKASVEAVESLIARARRTLRARLQSSTTRN